MHVKVDKAYSYYEISNSKTNEEKLHKSMTEFKKHNTE